MIKASTSLKEVEEAFERSIKNCQPIAAILIESIQGEGGDNHFHPAFFSGLREIANKYNALLIYDEVQTGVGMTGKWWAYQHHGIKPDILVFGKKMQLDGIMVSNRVHEVKDNVFQKPSRINSTWGGGLVDMVRATVILETIVNENLLDNASKRGKQLLTGLASLSHDCLNNVRGEGLMCAVDVTNTELRNKIIQQCYDSGVIILPCGSRSIRFRPALTISESDINEGLNRFNQAVTLITR
jgi:L-lysine 6-transaminase